MSRQVNLGQIVPNITIGSTTTGNPGTQASVTNVGTSLNPVLNFTIPKGDAGSIKIIIVAELPSTGADDTIYLVPITPDTTGNNYAEYVYINGAWEMLGKIGVQVDLQNYVQFTDLAQKTKTGVIKVDNYYDISLDSGGALRANTLTYSSYGNENNNVFIGKGTLENVITGKGLVSNTDYATTTTGGVVKVGPVYGTNINSNGYILGQVRNFTQYSSDYNELLISKGTLENVLTATIGDIQTLLDNLDSGSGV